MLRLVTPDETPDAAQSPADEKAALIVQVVDRFEALSRREQRVIVRAFEAYARNPEMIDALNDVTVVGLVNLINADAADSTIDVYAKSIVCLEKHNDETPADQTGEQPIRRATEPR